MLRALRKSVKTLPVKIGLGLLVASFAIWGIGDMFSFRLDSRVAKVGDTEISAEEYANTLQRQQRRLTQQLREVVSYDMMRATGMDRNILAGLMRDAAFSEELKRLGIDIPDTAVAEDIRTDPAFRDISGKFDPTAYGQVLAQLGISRATFENNRRYVLARGLLVDTAAAALTAPVGLGERIAAWQGETRKGAFVSLPLSMAADPGTPDDAALQAFYDAHHPMFTEPERRSGQYVYIDPDKLIATLMPDEEALKAQYEATKAQYGTPASRVVDQITYPDHAAAEAAQQELLSGSVTFEALAEKQGLKPGDISLGEVTPAQLPAAAATAVFGIGEPGVVGPVDLPAGTSALYRVTAITPEGVTPYEEVKDRIAHQMASDQLQYRAPEVANKLEELRAQGLSFAEMAKQAGADTGTFENLARDGTLPGGEKATGVLANQTFLTEVFTALDAEERDLVETPEHGYVLVMVQEIVPSALKPLDQVRDRAIAAWQDAERRKSLLAKGEELAKRLGQDASIYDIATEVGVEVQLLPPFTVMNTAAALPQALSEKLFRVAAAGGAAAPSADGDSVLVAQVSEIVPLAAEEAKKNASGIDEVLVQSLTTDYEEYYARAVEALHPGTVDNGVVQKVFERLGTTSAPAAPAGQ